MKMAGLLQQGAFRRLVNLGLLIGGFGLGQGSIFLAQTLLVARGKLELLALFGTHFSFAMLAIIAVEAGSLTVMSGQIARIVFLKGAHTEVWTCYWETTVFRVSVALLAALALAAVLAFGDLPAFSAAYLVWSLPGLLIWAFNAAGFLDGLQKSGISGITGSIAYVASALALLLAMDLPPAEAGRITGLALSLGYILTVAVQYIVLAAAGWTPRFVTPSAKGIRQAFVQQSSMLAGLMPGQLYFRAQLAISSLFLGVSATALLVYAKQVVGAASQISGFARRIEFPRLVEAVTAHPSVPVRTIFAIQKISFAIAALLAAIILVAAVTILSKTTGFTHDAWTFLAFFCVTIITESVGQALVQGLFAENRFHSAAIARISAVCIAIAFGYLVVGHVGIGVFILSDLLSHAIVVTLSLWSLKRGHHDPVGA
jgi:hypothetical protein